MIKNSNLEVVDAFIVYARPEPKINESSSALLNGSWFLQTIGEAAESLKVRVACTWTVVQEIMNYAVTKEILTISFLDFEKTAVILGTPSIEIGERDETNPIYIMGFEMAVMSNV